MKIYGGIKPFQVIIGGGSGTPKSPEPSKSQTGFEVAKNIFTPSQLRSAGISADDTFKIDRVFLSKRERTHLAIDTANYGRLWYPRLKAQLKDDFGFVGEIQITKEKIDLEWANVSHYIETCDYEGIARSFGVFLKDAVVSPEYIDATQNLHFWVGLANFEGSSLESSLIKRAQISMFQLLLEKLMSEDERQRLFSDLKYEEWELNLFQEEVEALDFPVSRNAWYDVDVEEFGRSAYKLQKS